MLLIDYIAALEELRQANGELEVEFSSPFRGRRTAPPPKIGYTKILSKRERKPDFFYPALDNPEQQGEKVVRLV